VYFALIFIAAIPFCAAIWAYSLIRNMTLPTDGLFQMALSEARYMSGFMIFTVIAVVAHILTYIKLPWFAW